MRQALITKIILISASACALSACGQSEVKTGSLVQRYTMSDAQGVVYGTVTMDPINGGTVIDAQGRAFARVVPLPITTAENNFQ